MGVVSLWVMMIEWWLYLVMVLSTDYGGKVVVIGYDVRVMATDYGGIVLATLDDDATIHRLR